MGRSDLASKQTSQKEDGKRVDAVCEDQTTSMKGGARRSRLKKLPLLRLAQKPTTMADTLPAKPCPWLLGECNLPHH